MVNFHSKFFFIEDLNLDSKLFLDDQMIRFDTLFFIYKRSLFLDLPQYADDFSNFKSTL